MNTHKGSVSKVAVPSPILLDKRGEWRRDPPRAPELRQPGYEREFDRYTLFYDICWVDDRVLLHGPPFRNLLRLLETAKLTALPLHLPCHLDDVGKWSAILFADVPKGTSELLLSTRAGPFLLRPQPDQARAFTDCRAIVAINKNNSLQWIRDWVTFYVQIHGCDAAIVYDNGSTAYTLDELKQTLASLNLKAHEVVYWPFTFGPGGGPANLWDSNYCQNGMLLNARWRFLRYAKSVLHADIDELVVHDKGDSVFVAAEQSDDGYCAFRGHWIVNISSNTADQVRHCNYHYRERESPASYPPKWSVVPSKCQLAQNWGIHTISGKHDETKLNNDFRFRHFRAISTNWKYDRSEPVQLNPDKHEIDLPLIDAFKRAGMLR
jgi:hypothetical protein